MIKIAEAHVSDVGTEIRLTITDSGVPVDLSTASELAILLRKPSGAVLTKQAAVVGDPGNGAIHCYTLADELDEQGLYLVQAKISLPAWSGHSDSRRLRVYANVDAEQLEV
jgi:hypothetical protein